MSFSLINEYRGNLLECCHEGRLCIVDERGEVLAAGGDVDKVTYYRSATKPIQALPVVVRGLPQRYGFTEREMALMAGSHAGQAFHGEMILSMLQKAGFREEDMIMLPSYPADQEEYLRMIREGIPPRKALHNCSGKHVALMLLSRELGEDYHDYWKLSSRAQQEVLHYISAFSEYPADRVQTGVDGCGVPVFAVPMRNMALSFLKLACPDLIEEPGVRTAVQTLTGAVSKYPETIRGYGFLCTLLNEDPNIIAKDGARGVYAIGLRRERLGIAFKVGDGSEQNLGVVVAHILRELHYENRETIEKIEAMEPGILINDNGRDVGRICSEFSLELGRDDTYPEGE